MALLLGTGPDGCFASWVRAGGVTHGSLAADEEDLTHELDAVVAYLYGLTEPQLLHALATFYEGWDFAARLNAIWRTSASGPGGDKGRYCTGIRGISATGGECLFWHGSASREDGIAAGKPANCVY